MIHKDTMKTFAVKEATGIQIANAQLIVNWQIMVTRFIFLKVNANLANTLCKY